MLVQGIRNRFDRSNESRRPAEPRPSSAASHNAPLIRSRTEVRVRKSSSSSESRRQELEPQVVRHDAIVPGERVDARVEAGALLEGERGEIEPDGPTLRSTRERRDVGLPQVESASFEQRSGLVFVHREIRGSDLQDLALRPSRATGRSLFAIGDRELRPRRDVASERGDRQPALRVVEEVEVIQGEDERPRILAIAPPSRGMTVPSIDAPSDVSASNAWASTGSMRSNAAAT